MNPGLFSSIYQNARNLLNACYLQRFTISETGFLESSFIQNYYIEQICMIDITFNIYIKYLKSYYIFILISRLNYVNKKI